MLGVVVLGSGCSGSHQPAPNASVQEFQKYYSSRKWYWVVPVVGLPADIPDYTPRADKHRFQVRLFSSDEQREILYMEMTPSRRTFAFHGHETLQRLNGVDAPLFGVAGDTNLFFGFFDHGACRIQVNRWGDDPARTQRELNALGTQIIRANQRRQ